MKKNFNYEGLTIKSDMNNSNWLTGEDVTQLLRISTRTLVNYRAKGILSFSQVGRKIYYKASDIQSHLDRHYIKIKL
jgi:hypothetical protein